MRNEQFSKVYFRLIYWLTSLYLSNKIAIKNRPIYSNSPHVTPLNSWPAFHCIELYRDLQAYFQHLTSLVKPMTLIIIEHQGKYFKNISIL